MTPLGIRDGYRVRSWIAGDIYRAEDGRTRFSFLDAASIGIESTHGSNQVIITAPQIFRLAHGSIVATPQHDGRPMVWVVIETLGVPTIHAPMWVEQRFVVGA